jgi:hypothetical protein
MRYEFDYMDKTYIAEMVSYTPPTKTKEDEPAKPAYVDYIIIDPDDDLELNDSDSDDMKFYVDDEIYDYFVDAMKD